MSNVEHMWLPPSAAVKPERSPISHRNPFEEITRNIRAKGFDVKGRHDRAEHLVEVWFRPLTPKAQQACKVAMGSSQAGGLKVAVSCGVGTDPFYAMVECIKVGLEKLKEAGV